MKPMTMNHAHAAAAACRNAILAGALALGAASTTPALAQDRVEAKSTIRFDHYRDHDELIAESKALAAAHPSLLTYIELGKSVEGRPLFALVLNNARTGPDTAKPGMYIDGNIHGNEIQASETVLYTAWYLVENYGKLDPITQLVDRAAFYFIPCANPDGRQNWFDQQNSPHSSRTGYRPTDDDRDGVADEEAAGFKYARRDVSLTRIRKDLWDAPQLNWRGEPEEGASRYIANAPWGIGWVWLDLKTLVEESDRRNRDFLRGLGNTDPNGGSWIKVLGLEAKEADLSSISKADLQRAYRKAVMRAHPDKGGSAEDFQLVQEAYEAAQRAFATVW